MAQKGAWQIDRGAFPSGGTDRDKLRFAVNYAVLAPSSHNSQPWLFVLEGDELKLLADRTRLLHAADPHGRELVISCGVALFHLRLALRHFGYEDVVSSFPASDQLASLRLGAPYVPASDEEAMFAAITLRRTNRGAYEARAPADALLSRLASVVSDHGATLRYVPPETRSQLTELILEGDRLQMANVAFRAELASWLRPNATRRLDGMPGYTQGVSALPSLLGPYLVRALDMGKSQSGRDRKTLHHSPVLAVLTTATDTHEDWLAAGQVLAALLLTARSEGVWASFMNQPVQVAALRLRLRALLPGDEHPQLILRLGHARDVRPTPRRPASEVTSG